MYIANLLIYKTSVKMLIKSSSLHLLLSELQEIYLLYVLLVLCDRDSP
jgi:hypothetical protein